jgi:hypothetical protein
MSTVSALRNDGVSPARSSQALLVAPAEHQDAIIDLPEAQRHHVLGVVLIELPRPP